MRVAVIDLGTNTFHLMLAEVHEKSHSIFFRERIPVKIGEKGINKNEITAVARQRALVALQEFNNIILENEIEKVFGTATSAIRNADNGEDLISEIKLKTGIDIEIISGVKEAELILLGAQKALDLGSDINLIMDIGGGSIEFIIADNTKTYWLQSFEIGGQRLVERFHKSDPIVPNEIENLHHFFDTNLSPLFKACEIYQPKTLIGCSGTFDTLVDIYYEQLGTKRNYKETEFALPTVVFDQMHQDLLKKSRSERLQIPGMIEMRVDMIVVASILIDYVMDNLALEKIRVSAYALKEGILFNVIDQIQAS